MLQLSRLGDILMSLPALEAISRKNRDAEIYFFINGLFEDLLPESPRFRLVPIHFSEIFEEFERPERLEGAMEMLKRHLGERLSSNFDLVVNLSGEKISAILNAAISARDKRGLLFSADGTTVNADPQLALFTEQRTGRKINWLHQVEIYSAAIDRFIPGTIHQSGKYLFGDSLQDFIGERLEDEGYILISSGASISQKEIGREILETIVRGVLADTDYSIVLCGTERERAANKEIHLINPERISDHTGETGLAALYNLIFFSDCLNQ